MTIELEAYLNFKLKAYANLSISDIPAIDLSHFNSLLSDYLNGNKGVSAKSVVKPEQLTIEPLRIDSTKPIICREARVKMQSKESDAIYDYLINNINHFGQKFILSPEILGIVNPNYETFDSHIQRLTNRTYQKTFPNVRISYRRQLSKGDHVYELTIKERF